MIGGGLVILREGVADCVQLGSMSASSSGGERCEEETHPLVPVTFSPPQHAVILCLSLWVCMFRVSVCVCVCVSVGSVCECWSMCVRESQREFLWLGSGEVIDSIGKTIEVERVEGQRES